MKNLVFVLLLGLPICLFSQLSDDFSDGDFTNNPSWIGQTDRFTVTNQELQLNDLAASSSNTSYLGLAAATSDAEETIWEFYVRQDFSPSGSNFARVFLQASNPDLTADQEGYYIRMGGASGDIDALEFYRQDGTSSTLLLADTPGLLATDPNEARVRVERTTGGTWTVEVDYNGGEDFEPVGMVEDATYTSGQYFGFVCRYSSTRADAFFFDNVLIDPLFVDTDAPVGQSAFASSETRVEVTFNEVLDPASVIAANFSITDGPDISAAQISGANPAIVELDLASSLSEGIVYDLNYQNVTDLAGNPATAGILNFDFINIVDPSPGDLIVTELMADPTPVVGLPNTEYIELHNTTTTTIRLGEVGLSTGSTPVLLPDSLISPGEYIIITDLEDVDNFLPFGRVIGIDGLPALTNGGDIVTLERQLQILYEINYDLDWYKNSDLAEGGYSLELIDRSPPYDCIGKWTASEATAGGTPGQQNSVDGRPLETEGPIVRNAFAQDNQTIVIQFDEDLDPASAEFIDGYNLDNGITLLDAILDADGRSVTLITNESLEQGQIYNLIVQTNIMDCLGNASGMVQTARLGLAEDPEPGDLVINELVYNAAVGGKDFIELYNRSNKIININGMRIAEIVAGNQDPIEVNYLVFPGEYVALTEDPEDVESRYTVANPLALLQNDMPTLDNDAGTVVLFSAGAETLDSFDYTEDFHNDLLGFTRGVSLERLDPNLPTNQTGNWTSAASVVNFGTPTGENSQFRPGGFSPPVDDILSLDNETFSPDGDGFEDVLLINYNTDQPNYIADIQIFDAQGRLVQSLLQNVLLSNSGRIIWDGTANDGRRAQIGIYILFAKIFTPSGDTREQKLTFVVAGRLD